jgi:hypothetical protein
MTPARINSSDSRYPARLAAFTATATRVTTKLAALADEIFIAYATLGGQLAKLAHQICAWGSLRHLLHQTMM